MSAAYSSASSSIVVDVQMSAYALSRLLHQPTRQAILRMLLAREVLSFSELKRLLEITDGNLSTHARRLEEAGFLCYTKGFRGRSPRTEYRLTPSGRAAIEKLMGGSTAISSLEGPRS